ncbi:MAG: succinyl-diaminopimelate desuccinylase [Gammaproteobacteria bacterium]
MTIDLTTHASIELVSDLISRPSVTPNDAGCQEMIANLLTPVGFKCEHLRFGQVDNLWARYGDQEPLFVFAGHTDVVPTGPVADWASPPFQPTIRDGVMYGRGIVDMKAAIAAAVVAAVAFVKEKPDFGGSIGFLITSDEEGPSIDGTKKVMETLLSRGEKIDYCVIGEPSSDKAVGDQIRVGRRGSLHCKLMIHGKQGHVAHPHLAKNPIHLGALVLHELSTTEWDKGNSDFPPTTFQISNIQAGTGAKNIIPGHLEVTFNFRFSTAVTIDELKKRVTDLLHKHHLQFDVEWEIGAEPFLTQKGRLLTATLEAIKSVTGRETRLSTGGGTSDGRFIAPTGAELVELGVIHAMAHQVNEHSPLEDIVQLTDIYAELLNRLF